jgi:hypothetical protein
VHTRLIRELEDGTTSLQAMNPDGSGEARIAGGLDPLYLPSWQPLPGF